MKKLQTIKLNHLSDIELKERELSRLLGGEDEGERVCGCGCHYENAGGSSTSDNMAANVQIGDSGGVSIGGNKVCYADHAHSGGTDASLWFNP